MQLKLIFLAFIYLFQDAATWSPKFIYKFLVPLSRMIGGQEIIWFISEELNTEHTSELDQFICDMHRSLQITQTVVTNNTEMRMSTAPAKRNHISLLFTTGAQDPIMEVFNKVLLGRHYYMSMQIVVQKIDDMEPIYELCRFNYRYSFFNSLIYFETTTGINQYYGVTKYPKFQIENRTDIMSFLSKKMASATSAITDVEGFEFVMPLQQNLPHLFKLKDRHHGVERLAGTTYRIIKTFIQKINGSLKDYNDATEAQTLEVVNMRDVLDLVRNREIEFSAHAYALFRVDDFVDKSYPLLVVKWCLMVPQYNSISTYFYPLKPFDWTVWFFVLGVLAALCVLEAIWLLAFYFNGKISRRTSLKRFHTALLNNFCYILNIVPTKTLQQPRFIRFLLFATIFFHGFFLTANYTSLLGSILTVNIFHAQINTMQDIIDAQLPVMIIDYEMDFLLSMNNDLPNEFKALLVPVNSTRFAQHQTSFNSSFAYFVTDDHWHFLDAQQQYLKQRIFKFSDICFGSYHLAYPMQMDSILWRDLEYFTFRIHSSGLLDFYERSTFEQAIEAKLVTRLKENTVYTAAGLDHLAIAFMCLAVVLTLAILCFLIEIFWFKFTQKRKLIV